MREAVAEKMFCPFKMGNPRLTAPVDREPYEEHRWLCETSACMLWFDEGVGTKLDSKGEEVYFGSCSLMRRPTL